MPPNRRAGKSAYIDKYFSKHRGVIGFNIHCKLCQTNDRDWSTRLAARRLKQSRRRGKTRNDPHIYDATGKRLEKYVDSWQHVMTLWTVHMGIHHPDAPQPDWKLPDDLDPGIEDVEHRFFDVSAEDELLRKIFGDAAPPPRKRH